MAPTHTKTRSLIDFRSRETDCDVIITRHVHTIQ